ncbi:MAG: alternative ribosome rescue aminoacyl-tRNA hydrolase ArfB [Phycisphaerales bacterium]|nr:alternative ribosome rescue aminoacyl-tRNA hydrolase ArfB [Planctomycetota bacterium]MCZ6542598.1 alternative ribosome rescue aminoacyl-tRNA hydrolase ArfB [Planctomycetota bacterium]MCZ6611825.1 alternative ribosome rescue aminoacyl-tRNA hydrolase ArfB [Planctomycetota bacterium]MCZ6736013.1 alternative ribosome rescue aminoacyl-tRNA hydrolase ArfB [Planctomycetota bacterium]MCZ6811878.1 alternative ribosome rescue aminoacyl-tRNA hydrolase ArfB [Planctomycetota bacterium]
MSSPPKPDRALQLAPRAWIDPADLQFSYSRASGPGGQAVNKLSSRAQLRLSVEAIVGLGQQAKARLRRLAGQRLTRNDELVIRAATYRSQLANKRACVERLRALVSEAAIELKKRKPSRPSPAVVAKRLEQKRQRSAKKEARRKPDPEE